MRIAGWFWIGVPEDFRLIYVERHAICNYMAQLGDRTKWYRTKWHGHNGTDKMVYGQNGMGQNVMDKMVWTKWYGQNGTDKMVVNFGIDYNLSEFNSYLVTKIHNEMINTQRKPIRLKVEAGLMKKSYCQWEWN